MRDRDQRLRNEVEHPERYEEVTITSSGVPIVLSVWHGQSGGPVVVFLPGTMTHPLFYEEFCDGLAARGVNVVGVHLEGHGKSPRVGRLLRLESLVANALDATAGVPPLFRTADRIRSDLERMREIGWEIHEI